MGLIILRNGLELDRALVGAKNEEEGSLSLGLRELEDIVVHVERCPALR